VFASTCACRFACDGRREFVQRPAEVFHKPPSRSWSRVGRWRRFGVLDGLARLTGRVRAQSPFAQRTRLRAKYCAVM